MDAIQGITVTFRDVPVSIHAPVMDAIPCNLYMKGFSPVSIHAPVMDAIN